MCLLGKQQSANTGVRGSPHATGAADVIGEAPLAIERDVLGLAGELKTFDVAQLRRQADMIEQQPAEAAAAMGRCDDEIEHKCDVGTVGKHPGEADKGLCSRSVTAMRRSESASMRSTSGRVRSRVHHSLAYRRMRSSTCDGDRDSRTSHMNGSLTPTPDAASFRLSNAWALSCARCG